MARQPFLKFFPKDWLSDSGLRLCSLAARGLWIDLLALMADAPEYGVLPFSEAEAPSIIANACGGASAQIKALLAELKSRGVYSVRSDGAIVSRRLLRDHAAYRAMSDLGQRGASKRYSQNTCSAIAENANLAIAENDNHAIAENEDSSIAENEDSAIAENGNPAIARKLRSSEAQKIRYGENEERGVESPDSPPTVRVRPVVTPIEVNAFGVLEPDVEAFVAAAAAENKTGTISAGRIQSLRRALLAARDEFPHAFSAALREANMRGKPSVNYLRAIAKHHEPPQRSTPMALAPDDEPMPDYLVAAAALHDRDFGAGGAA